MFFFLVVKFHTHVEAATLCATGGVHIFTCCSHTFCALARSLRTSHIFMRVTHALLKVMKKMFVACACRPSWFLSCFTRLRLLFLHGHFETNLTDAPRPHDPAELSRPKSAGQAHSARGRAVWLPGHVRPPHRLWAQRVRQDHFRGCWHAAHQRSAEPSQNPKVIYTDDLLEFGKSCEELSWNHRTTTPCRSETSEIADRAVRRVKEGTSAVLMQSGLNEKWW